MEEWRDVIGYDGLYQVSNIGSIKSVQRFYCRGGKFMIPVKECVRKLTLEKHGYLRVGLSIDGKMSNFMAHVLVAEAFIGPKPSDKHEVNHINGVKTDNRPENLEWVTRSENLFHAYRIGIKKQEGLRGEKNSMSKLTKKEVLEIRGMAGAHSNKSIAKKFSLSFQHVGDIVNRKRWKHI